MRTLAEPRREMTSIGEEPATSGKSRHSFRVDPALPPEQALQMSTQTIEQVKLRTVLGHFPTGVVAIAALDERGDPTAMVIGSFASVSLDPPLAGFFSSRTSSSYQRMHQSQYFSVNVFTAGQEAVCKTLAEKRDDKMDGVAWHLGPHGTPILDGCLAWLECELHERITAGDHDLILLRILDLEVHTQSAPLVFFQGGFGRFVPHEAGAGRHDSVRADPLTG
jgi:flavin reductase (DIM6/NTAB) family NADH-FMN oxidoreductase RutF